MVGAPVALAGHHGDVQAVIVVFTLTTEREASKEIIIWIA